jgi:hypothetical protein
MQMFERGCEIAIVIHWFSDSPKPAKTFYLEWFQ